MRRLMNQGKTLFLTTHFMDEAERLCHRLAIMDHGRIIAEGTPRQLIAAHIEPQVVEVYGEAATGWADQYGRAAAQRCEHIGETVFCYSHDADPIVHQLDQQQALRYLHRPANLEDVFLKLTGRELRD
jgi:lipooligosaccharide transport system ATP-binding protein